MWAGGAVLFPWIHTWSEGEFGHDPSLVRECALIRKIPAVFLLHASFGPPNVKIWTLATATFYESSIILVSGSECGSLCIESLIGC